MNPLEHVSTNDLWEEIKRRTTAAALVTCGEPTQREQLAIWRHHGNEHKCIALLEILKAMMVAHAIEDTEDLEEEAES